MPRILTIPRFSDGVDPVNTPTYINSTNGGTLAGGDSGMTLLVPSGSSASSWLVAFVLAGCPVFAPSGWTEIDNSSSGGGGVMLYVYARQHDGSTPGWSWSLDVPDLGLACGIMLSYSGSSGVDESGTRAFTSSSTPTTAAITTVANGSRVVSAWGAVSEINTLTAPTGWTTRSTANDDDFLYVAQAVELNAGKNPAGLVSAASAGSAWGASRTNAAISVSLAPA